MPYEAKNIQSEQLGFPSSFPIIYMGPAGTDFFQIPGTVNITLHVTALGAHVIIEGDMPAEDPAQGDGVATVSTPLY